MRIGIITVHDSANFGSFLQAYALQKVLDNMGHEVYFIKTRNERYLKQLFYKRPNIKKLIKSPFRTMKSYIQGRAKRKHFLRDFSCFNTLEHWDDIKLDKIILGSDEIWNITTPVFREKIFYGIEMQNVITYAVSIGKTKIESFNDYPLLTEAINKLGHILVRDENTYKIAEKYSEQKPDIVCDPTLLLPIEVFYKEYKNMYIEKNKYILLYSYSFTDNIRKYIITFAKKNDLKIVSACFKYDWADYYLNCSPLEFCEILKQADYVVTTTFHGSIFSFLNHKKFVSIPFSPKTDDLLIKVGLAQLIVREDCTYETFENKLLHITTDFQQLDKRIINWRTKSIELLEIELSK